MQSIQDLREENKVDNNQCVEEWIRVLDNARYLDSEYRLKEKEYGL